MYISSLRRQYELKQLLYQKLCEWLNVTCALLANTCNTRVDSSLFCGSISCAAFCMLRWRTDHAFIVVVEAMNHYLVSNML
jgi:hypothetical protein